MTSTPATVPGVRRVVQVLLVLLCVVLAAPAQLATAAVDPTTGPDLADTDLSVTILITSMTPDAVGPDAPITIAATITNTGPEEVSDLRVRLQRGTRQATRSEMGATDADPPGYDAQASEWNDIDGALAPGASVPIALTRTASELAMIDTGVYPVLVNVNGVTRGEQSRLGQSATYVPYFDTAPTTALSVGWLWPLIDRPHRGVDERYFLDDDLAASVRAGGRLDNMLRLAERFGRGAQMTLVVDPDLVADLLAMSDGYEVSPAASTGAPAPGPGDTTEGLGAQNAADFLTRLRVLAGVLPVATLAYGDPDIVALTRAGLGDQIEPARTTGAEIVRDTLGVDPIEDLDWPAGGLLTDAARDASVSAGVERFVLSGASFGQPARLSSPDGVTENPTTPMSGADGASTALAVDPTLSRIVAEGPTYAGGPVSARQRFTAELAAIQGEAPSRARTVLVTPPRYWNPPAAVAGSLLATPAAVPWVDSASLDQVSDTAPVPRGPLVYPKERSVQELPGAALVALQTALSNMADLGSALSTDDATTVLSKYQRTIWRAASVSSQLRPGLLAERGGQLLAALRALRQQVSIIPPSELTYTLSSASAPLVFTVQNNLDVAVKVRIVISARGLVGLKAIDAELHEVLPNSRTTITVPAQVERSGSFTIIAGISTPDGQNLGSLVPLTVRSTAYGAVALIVTGAAFALLLALFARRGVRRVRARRAAAAAPAEARDPADPADLEDTATRHGVP